MNLTNEQIKAAADWAQETAPYWLIIGQRIAQAEQQLAAQAEELERVKDALHVEQGIVKTLKEMGRGLEQQLAAQAARMAQELDNEQTRWQEAIYHKLCHITKDIPGLNIDGAGCDSGDPLDFTLSEIAQAICAVINQRDEATARITALEAQCGAYRWVLHDADDTIGAVQSAEAMMNGRTWKVLDEICPKITAALRPTGEPTTRNVEREA